MTAVTAELVMNCAAARESVYKHVVSGLNSIRQIQFETGLDNRQIKMHLEVLQTEGRVEHRHAPWRGWYPVQAYTSSVWQHEADQIYRLIANGARSTAVITAKCGLPHSRVISHLKALADAGRVERKDHGTHAGTWRITVVKGRVSSSTGHALKELLDEAGPLDLDDLRIRLCIASEARFEAVLDELERADLIDVVRSGNRAFARLVGDTRPAPMTDNAVVKAIYSMNLAGAEEAGAEA